MKKNYLKPTTTQVELKFESLLQYTSNAGGDKGTYNPDKGQLSRGGGDWDDED